MKIIHISDLHFGMHHHHIIDHFLNDVSTIKPDAILISGDLTQRAKTEQYTMFLSFLKKLTGVVCIVPGNHDISLHNIVSRMLTPFEKYTSLVSPNLSAQFENSIIRILGVNSVNPYRIKDGKLSSKTMSHIKQYFLSTSTRLNLLFFHHNFDYREGLHKPLENDQQFLSYLKESTIDIVCTGHSHYANVSLIEKNNHQPCLLLHAGSLLCKRSKDGLNSYYLVEAEKNHCTINLRVFNNNAFSTVTSHDIDFSQNYSTLLSSIT